MEARNACIANSKKRYNRLEPQAVSPQANNHSMYTVAGNRYSHRLSGQRAARRRGACISSALSSPTAGRQQNQL